MPLGDIPSGCVLHGVPYGTTCFACMPVTYWPPPAVTPLALPWVCPQCSRSLGPATAWCPFCLPQVVITSRQQGDRMVPVDPPETVPRPGEDSGRCPECNMPLAMHHDPGCSRPCGRCEERKARDAEEERLTIRLPPLMGHARACMRALLADEWREVLPGLQARMIRAVYACKPDGEPAGAELEFRLTPQDGQDRD